MEITLIRSFAEAAPAAANAYNTNLENRDEGKYIFTLRNTNGHHNVMEHNMLHIEFKDITLFAAEVIGSCRVGFSMVERSLRRTKSIEMYHPGLRHEALATLYQQEIERGVKQEDARYLLPDNILTTCRITINQLELENLMKKLADAMEYDCWPIAGRLVQILPTPPFSTVAQRFPLVRNIDRKPYVKINIDDDGYNANDAHPRYSEFSDTTIYDSLSRVAYQQLKRHRTMSLLPEPYDIEEHFFPYESDNTRAAAELAAEDNIVIGATKRWFKMKINHRSLKNFFRLRCDKHAQKEIRDWATELRSKHEIC